MNKTKRITGAILGAVMLASMTACGVSTQPDTTKLQIGAGPFEDPKIKGCIAPSTKKNSPTNDKYIAYPVSGRDYDAGTTEGSDSGPITVVSSDNAEMAIPVRLVWDFASDCDSLKKFYQMYNRYGASLDNEGQPTEGWNRVQDKVMGNTLDTTLDEVAKKYKWRELYNDAQAQNDLQASLNENIQDAVNEAAKGEFFLDIKVATMKKPLPTNSDLLMAIASEQSNIATAQSAEAKARAEQAQAEAETATARAQAAKKRAEIDGFRVKGMSAEEAIRAFNEAQAIENGLNPWQPTYKVSDTQ